MAGMAPPRVGPQADGRDRRLHGVFEFAGP